MKKAVVLLSGGLNSATVLALACRDGFECHALSVDYGQRDSAELGAAKRVAEALGAREHRVFALAWAEALSASAIFIGANAVDYSGYPDWRPEYVQAFEAMANLATVDGRSLTLHAPLVRMTKAQITVAGLQAGVDFRLTVSGYPADDAGNACGACRIRRTGFAAAGIDDPARYRQHA